MKRTKYMLALIITLGTAKFLIAQCGIKPIGLPPIAVGCNNPVQKCSCDSQGHCHWVWVCQ